MYSSSRGAAVIWTGLAVQLLGLTAGGSWTSATPLGMLLCAWGLYQFHRAKGHSARYTLIGTAAALLPVLGPVMGLLLSPPQPSSPAFSYAQWGWALLIFALLWSASPSMQASSFALGCLTGAVLAFAAWAARRAGRGTLAGLLFLSSFGGCAVGVGLGFVADPRLHRRSNEVVALGNLGAMRSALSLYRDDHKTYPLTLEALTVEGRYLVRLNEAKTQLHHPDSATVRLGSAPGDSGGWLYDPAKGELRIDCTHTDTRGKAWASY